MKRLKRIANDYLKNITKDIIDSGNKKINALAEYLKVDPKLISVSDDYYIAKDYYIINDGEHKGEEYLVLTEEESYEVLQDIIDNDIDEIGFNNLFNKKEQLYAFITQCVDEEPFKEFWEEDYYVYAEDIENETGDKYANRLIDECMDAGVIDESEIDENGKYIGDEDLCQLLSDYLVETLDERYIEEYIDEFGGESLQKFIDANCTFDCEAAADWLLQFDDYGDYIACYDGKTIYLEDDLYAFRIN